MSNFMRFVCAFACGFILVGCHMVRPSDEVVEVLTPKHETTLQTGRCGDGTCDGPENPSKCPQDCSEGMEDLGGEYEAGPEENSYWLIGPEDGRRLFVLAVYPADWNGEELKTLVLVPGGSGDSTDFLGAPRFTAATLADAGYVVVVFDPDGRGRSEGREDYNGFIHQDSLADVLLFADDLSQSKEGQIGLISFSYGITMAAGTLARYPQLPAKFLIDWEGPADRNDTGGCDEDHRGHLQEMVTCDDEAFWAEHEALRFIADIQVPYQRLQSEKDHAQPDNDHAIAMVNMAIHGGVTWVRLNDLPVNQVYDPSVPPPMLPESSDRDLAVLLIPYIEEIFTITE